MDAPGEARLGIRGILGADQGGGGRTGEIGTVINLFGDISQSKLVIIVGISPAALQQLPSVTLQPPVLLYANPDQDYQHQQHRHDDPQAHARPLLLVERLFAHRQLHLRRVNARLRLFFQLAFLGGYGLLRGVLGRGALRSHLDNQLFFYWVGRVRVDSSREDVDLVFLKYIGLDHVHEQLFTRRLFIFGQPGEP